MSPEARPSQIRRREMKQNGQHHIVSDPFIRTAISSDAERCLAVLTLLSLVIRLAAGPGLIRNDT
jgi:hypothetical protein